MNMKMKSTQIITVIVAFLVGILVASAVMRNKSVNEELEKGNMEGQMENMMNGVNEENTENTEEVKEAAVIPVKTTTPAKTTTPPPTPAPAKTVSATNNSGSCQTGLSGRKDDKLNAIVLNWTACKSDEFQFYKLVKSSTNANPNYPADSVAFSSSNKNSANFIDKTVAPRTTYHYKMCIVQRLGVTNCSNVATVSF